MPKNKKSWRKGKSGKGAKQNTAALDQPVAKAINAVPCRICGHPVDAKRMQFHMVRFHGAALRPLPPATP